LRRSELVGGVKRRDKRDQGNKLEKKSRAGWRGEETGLQNLPTIKGREEEGGSRLSWGEKPASTTKHGDRKNVIDRPPRRVGLKRTEWGKHPKTKSKGGQELQYTQCRE